MASYKVYLWKTVVLETVVSGVKNAQDARDKANNLFCGGAYDGKWGDADTTRLDILCDEEDKLEVKRRTP